MCEADEVALVVEPARTLHMPTGRKRPWRMSSSRLQISFTGMPGICLAILHGLGDVVLAGAAPAEAAAQVVLVDLALGERQAGGFGSGGQRASPFCVATHTSHLSAVTLAVQFIGSMQAWFW